MPEAIPPVLPPNGGANLDRPLPRPPFRSRIAAHLAGLSSRLMGLRHGTTAAESESAAPSLQPEAMLRESGATDGVLHEYLSSAMGRYVSPGVAGRLRSTYGDLVHEDTDPVEAAMAGQVLVNGTVGDRMIDPPESIIRHSDNVFDARRWMATLMSRHPETAQTLVGRDVVGLHATKSSALPGIMVGGGLLSGGEMHRKGQASVTGGRDANPHGTGQSGISFSRFEGVRLNAQMYAGESRIRTDSEVVADLEAQIAAAQKRALESQEDPRMRNLSEAEARNATRVLADFKADPSSLSAAMLRDQFPVLVGISRGYVEDAERRGTGPGSLRHVSAANLGEFRVGEAAISIEDGLPVFAVPADKVAYVAKLLAEHGHAGVSVVPVEHLVEFVQGVNVP